MWKKTELYVTIIDKDNRKFGRYRNDVATKILSKIMREIRDLQENPEKGHSVENMLGIPTSYM